VNVNDLKGQTVAFCASGGLDSCTITHWLSNRGVNVITFTADLGQPDEVDVDSIATRMRACGATDALVVPLRDQLADLGIEAIHAQARYEGPYWNVCSLGRHVTVKGILREATGREFTALSHGATGRGNDQVRFQIITNLLRPDLGVYAPWRDPEFLTTFGGREQMIEYCVSHGLPLKDPKRAKYSTDANLLGLTHEAGELESLSTPAHFVEPQMGVRPIAGQAFPERVTVRFVEGWPVELNGVALASRTSLFEQLNCIAGRHGVGINIHMVENRFVGVKSRGVYETPGMELLGHAYGLLLQVVLDRRARDVFEFCSNFLGRQLYEGFWYSLGAQAAREAIARTAQLATGTVTVELYRGNVSFIEVVDAPHSLYVEEYSSMEAGGGFNHADSEGFTRVVGLGARVAATRGHIRA
jgi:argininosuccinate synthase